MSSAELTLTIAREAVERSNGLAIDIGGSAVKLAYRHKSDWEELQQQHGDDNNTAKVRMRVFAKDDLEDALKFVMENCHISREGGEPPLINITGFGGNQFNELIKKTLNVRTQVLSEDDCFLNAFTELSRSLAQKDFEHMPTAERMKELQAIMAGYRDAYSVMLSRASTDTTTARPTAVDSLDMTTGMTSTNSNLPIAQALPNLYPCLMYLISSASCLITVYSEKDYEYSGLNINGGVVFLGLGNAICRSKKTYDELIDLAEKGHRATVDHTVLSIRSTATAHGQDNIYADVIQQQDVNEETLYPFGRLISGSPESAKTEDMLRSMLETIIRYHVETLITSAVRNETPHIFLVGSFFNRQLVRTIFEEACARQKVLTASIHGGKGMDIEIHFVKTAGYLGSIGAFLNNSVSTTSLPK